MNYFTEYRESYQLIYHIMAFSGGFLLDLILGDPYSLPHPVRLIGRLIEKLDRLLRCPLQDRRNRQRGALMVLVVLFLTGTMTFVLWKGAYLIHPLVGILVELIMTYQVLATKCLKVESNKVYQCFAGKEDPAEGLEKARQAVSMIVGRDTRVLDEEGVIKAAVETVAENTSDGVIAPMLYTAIGGPVLGFLYKAVNTMDSMVGYKNEKYLDFGRAAAKTDDVVNFLPARLSAVFMIAAAFLGGKDLNGREAVRIYKRDRRKHASPNSAQTEAVCAGALGVRLAGDASYFGKLVKKPYIGDAGRRVEPFDIVRANRLLYLTAWIGELVCVGAMVWLQR